MLSNETFWVIDKDCENGQKMLYPILKTSTAPFRLSFVTIIWEEGGLKACQNSVPFWRKCLFSLLYQILKAILEYSVIDIKMRNKDLWMHYADFRQTTLLMALFQYLMMFPENRSKVSGRLLGTECDSFLYLFTLFTYFSAYQSSSVIFHT